MAKGALIAGGVEVVQQGELLRERVVIRRDGPAEHRHRRIAFAGFDIAEHLFVGAVFLNESSGRARFSAQICQEFDRRCGRAIRALATRIAVGHPSTT
jgi:hypothetical protein